jgi:hypothetical protein
VQASNVLFRPCIRSLFAWSFQPLIFSQSAVFFLSQQISQHYFQPFIFSPNEQADGPNGILASIPTSSAQASGFFRASIIAGCKPAKC